MGFIVLSLRQLVKGPHNFPQMDIFVFQGGIRESKVVCSLEEFNQANDTDNLCLVNLGLPPYKKNRKIIESYIW